MTSAWSLRWCVLRTAISERLTYRGDFVLGTLVRFLPIVTQVFLWTAVYGASDGQSIQGYGYRDMVAYSLLVMLARAFSSMPGLAGGIAREIREGSIKKYLTQPVDMLGFLFWSRVAHKLVYYAVACGPFALVFWLLRDYFARPLDAVTVLAFGTSLILGFLIGFLTESLIGLIGFWFLDVSSLIFIFMMLNYFLSGHMLPLDWLTNALPENSAWRVVAQGALACLPFQYMAYFPASVMLGKVTGANLAWNLLLELGWVLALYGLNRLAFARGVARYSAFGG
jgi:ABC-2 type transport system permease protein